VQSGWELKTFLVITIEKHKSNMAVLYADNHYHIVFNISIFYDRLVFLC